MSGHRPDYNTLKNEHSEIDHEQVAQEREASAATAAAAAEQELTWTEKTAAKYDAKRQLLQDKYANNEIGSRALLRETGELDLQEVREYEAKTREEAKARGETLPQKSHHWNPLVEQTADIHRDKDDREL